VLVYAEAVVKGIGGGANYVYLSDEELRQTWDGLTDDVIRWGEDQDIVFAGGENPTPEYTLVDDGGCQLFQPLLYESTTDEWIASTGNNLFNAFFRYSQAEYLSLADNGDNVHGGFARGGVRRDESQQWDIFKDGGLFYEVDSFVMEEDTLGQDLWIGDATPPGNLNAVFVHAGWAGRSIENFSGEEADGFVEVGCIFVEDPGRR